jgi:type IV pilus assembly protein PilE
MLKRPVRQLGFTLTELMVVLVILGILYSVALPRYSAYSLRANRTDGIATLNEIMQAQERYAADQGTYTTALTDLGLSIDTDVTSADGHYKITATQCDDGSTDIALCVYLTAVAQGTQADDTTTDDDGNDLGGDLFYTSRGEKGGW